MSLTLGVSSPLKEYVAQSTLEVILQILFGHQRHDLAVLCHSIIELAIDFSCLLDEIGFLLFKLFCVSCLNQTHISHLLVDLADFVLGFSDSSYRLPIFHHCHQVFGILHLEVLKRASDYFFFVLVLSDVCSPHFEGASNPLKVGTGKSI